MNITKQSQIEPTSSLKQRKQKREKIQHLAIIFKILKSY